MVTILLHLRFQLLDGGESLNIAQPLDPFDPNPLTVQIAVEVEEVSFERAPSVLERGTGALAHHSLRPAFPPLYGHGIHPIGWQKFTGRDPGQIDGGHPESTAATLSFTNLPNDPVGPAQHRPRTEQISSGYRPANPAAGHVLSGIVHRLHHVHLKTLSGAHLPQRLNVSTSSPAEPVIVADHQLLDGTPLEQNLTHETLRRESRQIAIEVE